MIPSNESLTVEFKSDQKGIPDRVLAEEVTAMANADGGTIYVGVEDDGTVTGAKTEHLDPDGARAIIANLTFPPVFVGAEIVSDGGKRVLRLTVPRSESIVSTSSGKTLQRRIRYDGKPEMKPFFPYEFESRRSFFQQTDPSRASLFPYRREDLDDAAVSKAMAFLKKNPTADKTLLGLGQDAFLSSLEAVVMKDGVPMFTLAGLLLFAKKEALRRFVGTYGYVFQRVSNGIVVHNEDVGENIIQAFSRFEEFCKAFKREDELIVDAVRYGVPVYDEMALREGFANAIAHRDYSLLGAIRVLENEAGLFITSPGELIQGLRSDRLIGASPRGRNPLLSDCLKRIGLCERTGRGVDRIYESAARYGKKWPSYASSDEASVTLYLPVSKIDQPFARFILKKGGGVSPIGIISLAFLRKAGGAKTEEIAAFLGMAADIERGYLDDLLEMGLVESNGDSFRLGFDSAEGRTLDDGEIQNRIERFAADHDGFVTSSDVQKLLGYDGGKAYRILSAMVKKGLIEKVSGGKYAKYRLKK